ncbi:unnamed protein product [Coregonus sp. 'balchen']|nr:unnamed protein product [Coregonus sp. 'balchen']
MANQVSESPAERTFQYQHRLPPLPVPSLEGSLAKYLDAVRPFATEEEYQVTAAILKRFGEGIGKDLHQKLLQRARTHRNWLEEWWLDAAYLELRYPSQLNVNFGGPAPYLEHCWPPTEGAREYLIGIDPANKTLLETIQSSLFVVSLDDAKPYATAENYTPLTREALIGDPTIRWGDKSYNSISFADGTFGSNCDHAPYDAMVLVTQGYYVDQQLKATDGKWKGSETVRPMPLPEELVFTVDDRVRSDIAHAKQQYFETTQDLQVVCYAFTSFGKAAIKQRKLHPDTFIQLALQLAYYRQHGRSGSCYETAMTRRFYHGRTETMRPCTLEAQNWCRIMLNPVASAEAKRKALLLAFNKHNKLMAEAQNGKGFDRHLLGLIVASCSAWKSSPETDAETLFQNLVTSLHEMLHLATTAQL